MTRTLPRLLRNPELAFELSLAEWDLLIPQLRQNRLLGSLRSLLVVQAGSNKLPEEVWRHLNSGWRLHEKQRHSLAFEVEHLVTVLAEVGEPLLLLKGGAYLFANLPPAAGRLISDIDILVHGSRLSEVESALVRCGWSAGAIDPYNERYYRRWMHEIPPMEHVERGSTLDVHHTLLPPTCAAAIDPDALWQAARELRPGIMVLSPVDMVLHSAAHLFHEGDFGHGLRDLWDLDCLLRYFAETEGALFYAELAERAVDMSLHRPLYYALRYARKLFETPVGEDAMVILAPLRPAALQIQLMDFLFTRAFTPFQSAGKQNWRSLAAFCLYLRSHYLRMPLSLLVPHLLRKAWMDYFPPAANTQLQDDSSQDKRL